MLSYPAFKCLHLVEVIIYWTYIANLVNDKMLTAVNVLLQITKYFQEKGAPVQPVVNTVRYACSIDCASLLTKRKPDGWIPLLSNISATPL